jgi:hypothetical protein
MRRHTGSPAAVLRDGWTYSETIDEEASAIHTRGRLDRLALDLLCGTIEGLYRRGHQDIAVTIELPGSVDPCVRAALAEMSRRLESRHGRLRVSWTDGDGSPRSFGSDPTHRHDPVAASNAPGRNAHRHEKG